jgi:hypothetical protein
VSAPGRWPLARMILLGPTDGLYSPTMAPGGPRWPRVAPVALVALVALVVRVVRVVQQACQQYVGAFRLEIER